MIRPEVRAGINRYREAVFGGGLTLVGLYWVLKSSGLLGLLGPLLVVIGLALVWIGIQRGRFRTDGDGPGAVQVDEGQIAYFGPISGGVVAVRELERVTLDGESTPPHWLLEQPGTPPLSIPLDAHGADALFDAFASLPGLRTERMLSELRKGPAMAVVIWERSPARPSGARLH